MSKRSRRQHFDLMHREDPQDQRRDITVRSYAVRASSLNEQARTVDAVMATEQPVQVFDMRTWSVIREILLIDGGTFPDQVPLLDSHDRSSIKKQLGSTRSIHSETGDPNKLIGTRHLSSVADAQEAFTKMREGHLRDGSIGYRVTGFSDLQPGEGTVIRGREFKNTGPDVLRISYEWRVMEDSLTPIGADDLAKTRSTPTNPAERAEPPKEQPMDLNALIAQFGEKHRALLSKALADGKTLAQITSMVVVAERAEAETAVRATPAAGAGVGGTQTTVPPPAPVVDETARAAGMRAERERAIAIRQAAGSDIPAAMVDQAINEDWDVARANVEFLAEMRRARGTGASTGSAVVTGQVDRADAQMRALEVAVALDAGISPVVERRGQRVERMRSFRMPNGSVVVDAQAIQNAEQFRGIGLRDLARLCLRAQGLEAPVNVGEFFERSVSTVSLPNILGNTLRRTLEASYEEAPATLLEWASTDELQDFRPSSHLRLGKFGRPSTPGDGGEFDYASLTEAKETQQIDTSGIWFGITRKQFINDDLRGFTRVPTELGLAMKRNIDDIGYDLLISASGVGPTMNEDAKALFATNHADGANYSTSGVLAAAGLGALKTLMRKMKQGSVTLNLIPVVLLVPPELEFTAQQLVQSSTLIGTTTTDAPVGSSNPHFGKLKVVVEPRLSAATNGTTAWYLVCAPAQAKSLVVSYLRGATGPQIERRDPQKTLGLGWIAYHDVGVDAVDFRGIARSR